MIERLLVSNKYNKSFSLTRWFLISVQPTTVRQFQLVSSLLVHVSYLNIIVYRQFARTALVTCANSDVANLVVTAKSLCFLLPADGFFTNLITVQQDATYSIYYISVGGSTHFGC